MSLNFTHVQGFAELQKTLLELPAKIEANILRGALRAGAQVIAEEVRTRAPEDTGTLKESVRVSTRLKRGSVHVTVKAGGRSRVKKPGRIEQGAYWGSWVEYGTAPHWIKPKNRKSLFIAGLMREIVKHPGARARPFMRPAFDASHLAAVSAVRDYIAARLPKEIAKHGVRL